MLFAEKGEATIFSTGTATNEFVTYVATNTMCVIGCKGKHDPFEW